MKTMSLAGSLLATLGLLAIAADEPASARRADQEALKVYGELVGSWRGAGQPKRGQATGAWKESMRTGPGSSRTTRRPWRSTSRRGNTSNPPCSGRARRRASLLLEATLADGSKRTFSGKLAKDRPLVLTAEGGGEGVRRVSLTIPNENRFLLLLESEPASKTYARLGEVGFTRNGVAFAAGESGPVCIVTEGRGTIQVSHKGKSYYVCCSGCRDLFNKDPEAILAEAAERAKKKEKK